MMQEATFSLMFKYINVKQRYNKKDKLKWSTRPRPLANTTWPRPPWELLPFSIVPNSNKGNLEVPRPPHVEYHDMTPLSEALGTRFCYEYHDQSVLFLSHWQHSHLEKNSWKSMAMFSVGVIFGHDELALRADLHVINEDDKLVGVDIHVPGWVVLGDKACA